MKANGLVALGAPELPEGYFYRVKSSYIGTAVEVRRKHRFGSAYVTETYVVTDRGPFGKLTPEEALISACRRVARHVQAMADERAERDTLAEYIGDHQ
ncbi:hypothetical protein AB0K74_10665 [Streptomyces sp. NPDC056159]|uniref:hypothetical protein n=1 Tax=Streptomyces sp. NPDC056159 TaxID=3155537 RepID=UPI003447A8D4